MTTGIHADNQNKRGAVLGMVIVIALITAIGAYTLLLMAASQARQAQAAGVNVQHTRARYAAEGGLVWAQQNLLTTPGWCGGNTTVGTAPPVNVNVTVTNCAGNTHEVNATADY